MDTLTEILASLESPADLERAPSVVPEAEGDERPGLLTNAAEALRFILAGNATVTFKGQRSRFTYKINQPKDDPNSQFMFVALMSGPDNENSFQYLGYLRRGVFFWGKKSKIGRDAPSVKAFEWTYKQLCAGRMPPGLEIWHEGKCGRCGHKLTVPESIASGFGPECAQHIFH